MQLQEHIIATIPVFKVKDSSENLVRFFQENPYSHVAIEEEGAFLGVFSENDIEAVRVADSIENFRYELESFHVNEDTSWLDVLEVFARNEANVIPILNAHRQVIGYYDLTDVVSLFIDTPFFTDAGSIIVVATGIHDYSFSQIAQIVESNNARLIGAFITDTQNDVIQVTLKITTDNHNKVLQTFRRYNYHVLFGNSDDQFIEDLKNRSKYLDKYLNV